MKKLGGVIEAQQFDSETINAIFRIAEEMEKKPDQALLQGKLMASLFYEPSTRTRFSFESAMKRQGGAVISTENARQFSSKAKGESLEDSIRVISAYCDVIVLRYHKEGGAERAQQFSRVPVINAGDGKGQHPTQALLDLYTIRKAFKKVKGLTIAMVGDLANGRTVRSLSYFLGKHFPDNNIIFVSPEQTKMADDIKAYLKEHNISWNETDDLRAIAPEADVIYQTRVQRERFQDDEQSTYEQVVKASERFIINDEVLGLMKKQAIIMHPLPRITEISFSVDKDPRARYFEQAENGLYVRMALLKMILAGY
ncbi:MAG: aspartate carbamoyltransferase [Nitrospirota bacterium]